MEMKFDRQKLMAKIIPAVRDAVEAGAEDLAQTIRDSLNRQASNISAGGIPSAPGEPPAKNTGALARSIVAVKATDSTDLKPHWRTGTNMIYAAIQEYGGRIVARKSKSLAVPIGVDGRRAARSVQGDIRQLKLIFIKTKTKALLGKMTGKVFKPLFILLKSVHLPARPYMRPAYAQKKNAIKIRIELAIKGVVGKGAH